MSRSVYYARLGLFVLVGTFVVFATVIYVGSVRLFASELTVLMHFRESVNGLSVGSPVKFKGVTVGSVSQILVAHDRDHGVDRSSVPVFAKISMERVRHDVNNGPGIDFNDGERFRTLVDNGLRARLEMQSFITGQLYVELDYFADPGAPYALLQYGDEFAELPTTPSTMAELGASASSLMASLASIDIKGLNDSTRRLLSLLEEKLSVMETEKWNEAILRVSTNLEAATRDLEIRPLLTEIRTTNRSLQELVMKVDQAVEPAVKDYHETMVEARDALASIEGSFSRLDRILASNEFIGSEVEGSLLEVREAARALREFLEFLERNPRALLTGRER